MNTHTERPDAVKRHNWQRLYKALDKLAIGESLAIDLGSDGYLHTDKTRAAINRHYEKQHTDEWSYFHFAQGNKVIVAKTNMLELPPKEILAIWQAEKHYRLADARREFLDSYGNQHETSEA